MTIGTNQCQHGSLARVCELCEAQREIERLRTEVQTMLEQIAAAPRGISAAADFELMTWTFEIEPGCPVGRGVYALVWLPPEVTAGQHRITGIVRHRLGG